MYDYTKVLFLVEELTTTLFNYHYHAYEVTDQEETAKQFISSGDLYDPVPLNIVQSCKSELLRTSFVVTRYKFI